MTSSAAYLYRLGHPVLPVEGASPLRLRLIGGLTTVEIARAFLVPGEGPWPAKSFGRKELLAESPCVPFEMPRGEELRKRSLRPYLVGDLFDLQRRLYGDVRR